LTGIITKKSLVIANYSNVLRVMDRGVKRPVFYSQVLHAGVIGKKKRPDKRNVPLRYRGLPGALKKTGK